MRPARRLVNRPASWTSGPREPFPPAPSAEFPTTLDTAWRGDGLVRTLAHRWQPDLIQLTFEASPQVSPSNSSPPAPKAASTTPSKSGWPHSLARKSPSVPSATTPSTSSRAASATRLDLGPISPTRVTSNRWPKRLGPTATSTLPNRDRRPRTLLVNLHLVAVTERRWRIGREDFLPKIPAAVRALGQVLVRRRPGRGAPARRAFAGHHARPYPPLGARSERLVAGEIAGSLRDALNRAAGRRLFDARVYAGTFSTSPLSHIRPR